jgi:hypothetical protein
VHNFNILIDVWSDFSFIYTSSHCSGESMENALRACCKGIKIGKILIHRVGDNGQQVSIQIL